MDMKQIKELMAAMEKTGLKKVRIKEEKGYEIELEREGQPLEAPAIPARPYHETAHHFSSPAVHSKPVSEQEMKKDGDKKSGTFVSSPLVGTFYSAPSPEDPPYVKAGETVDENTVVCIIEAMKVMNEVKAGKKGKVAEVLLENGDPVEYGTHLFRII